MTYTEALRYLDSFIDYERIGYKSRELFKLERMRHLAQIFGNPQDSFRSIHISGTKGKGSIACFIYSMLREAGFDAGLYTSPHLISPRERIRLNNGLINRDDFAFQVGRIKAKLGKENLNFSPTFFEIYTVLAFNYFKTKKIDYGVIEVGLGGRLDATNIVHPLVSAISPISYEHTHILGKSLEQIAIEKTDIIKSGCISVSVPQEGCVLEVILKKCRSLGLELVLVGKDIVFKELYYDAEKEIFDVQGGLGNYKRCTSRLLGRHQIANASCAVGIAEALKKKGAKISEESIKRGIEKTENPGRCEVIIRNPYVILDGAQNRASAGALKETIMRNFAYRRLILVLGISKEKDIRGVCEELVPLADIIILTKADVERGKDPRVIKKFIKEKETILTDSVRDAMKTAWGLASTKDLILTTGSFFVIGEAKRIIHKQKLVKG